MVAGIAGLVAGAMSMAAERAEIKADDKAEHQELAAIYVQRGLDAALAKQVAKQLMAHDALAAHARDELGISRRSTPPSVGFALAQGPRHYLFDTVHNGDSLAPGVLRPSEFSSSMIIMTELRR